MQDDHTQLIEPETVTAASPAPVVAIGYADTRTDRGRRDPLSPDLIEARIAANAIGGGFLLVGFLFLCVLGTDNSWLLTSMVAAAYVLPGGALLWAAYLIAKRRKAGVVVATAGGCWVMLAMAALATAELVGLLRADRPVGYPWFRVLIHLLFLGLAAKLAFHAFRAALFTGRSDDAGVAVWLTPEGAMPRLPEVRRVMLLVSLGSQLLLLAVAGGCWYLATALKTPMPARPAFAAYIGGVNLPSPNGLGPTERAAVTAYLKELGLEEGYLRAIDVALRDQAGQLFPPPAKPIADHQGLDQVFALPEADATATPATLGSPIVRNNRDGSVLVQFQSNDLFFAPRASKDDDQFATGAMTYSGGRWSQPPGRTWWSVAAVDEEMQATIRRIGKPVSDVQGRALVRFVATPPPPQPVGGVRTFRGWPPPTPPAPYDQSFFVPFERMWVDADGNLRATTPRGDVLVTPAGQVFDADQDDRDRELRTGRWEPKLDLNPSVPRPLAWCALAGVLLALWPLLHRRSIERLPIVWACLRLALLGASVLATLWLLSSIFVTALESAKYGPAVAATIVATVLAILIVAEGIWFPLILVQAARIRRKGAAQATAPPQYPF